MTGAVFNAFRGALGPAGFLLLASVVGVGPVVAADESGPARIEAVPGSKVVLACQTNAIGLDFEPFKTSKGQLDLVLDFFESGSGAKGDAGGADGADAPDQNQLGTWTVPSGGTQHKASMGVVLSKVCKAGCVLRVTPAGNLELWAPRPLAPTALGENETVTIATLDAVSLELKATTFRGKELSILENGKCEVKGQ